VNERLPVAMGTECWD